MSAFIRLTFFISSWSNILSKAKTGIFTFLLKPKCCDEAAEPPSKKGTPKFVSCSLLPKANLKVFTFNGGGAEDTDTGFNVATGEIAHVGMVHNALTSRAGFKNGELSAFVSKWSTQNFANIVLAGDHSEGGSFLAHAHSNITYYCVKLYNRALSAKEVKQNYDERR